jgi:hypothetical protein
VTPISEARGTWKLTTMPHSPERWMKAGEPYTVILRRYSAREMPEVEIRHAQTDKVLATYSWHEARMYFNPSK